MFDGVSGVVWKKRKRTLSLFDYVSITFVASLHQKV